ncbi:ABC transporter ATP-binding protein [Candidatus Woesearchaeota archaeon]|nr:ABC transporter ATP-binding protein [Candidatus Woesearchaeota archaeon]
MNKIINLNNVWKKYHISEEPLIALKEINLNINKGEFVAITGPSGSGKSTIANLIGALDKPSVGSIYLKGKNISEMSESSLAVLRGKTIGFIFQQFNLIPNLTALQNVMLPMDILDIHENVSKQRAVELLISLGLEERLNHKPNQLSGGQQQRVAIARALANNPDILLADEPTGNLDSETGKFVMNYLERINKEEGKTIILITHDLDLLNYSKRTVYIKDGKIEKDTIM